MKHILTWLFSVGFLLSGFLSYAQETRLLRDPDISETHIVFAYGGDLWITGLEDNIIRRLTSTPAVEAHPVFSPDGKTIAFSSNRSGAYSVYTVPVVGGTPTRLTWYPANSWVRDWTPDGQNILYASSRGSAPTFYEKLWTVSKDGGPSELFNLQWGYDGSFSPDGTKLALDRVSRWDSEWRAYRGGQNTPLIILDPTTNTEEFIPNDRTTDIKPLWIGNYIYFLSDRDLTSNIWAYHTEDKTVSQITKLKGSDIKSLAGHGNRLIFERDGYLHLYDISTKKTTKLEISIKGDFPWAETKWEDVTSSATSASISPNAKRAIFEARGDIFTVPAEKGDTRNITASSGVADRRPIWSPSGENIAWFTDKSGKGYELVIASQDGQTIEHSYPLGEAKLGWEPTWSPDGAYIAFTDNDVRIKVINVNTGEIISVDVGGNNLERGNSGLTWSPDSKWLAYTKTGENGFRNIMVWSGEEKTVKPLTNPFADAFAPCWDQDMKHLYFLASTDLALGSGWANTSAMTARPEYAAYVINLDKDDPSPFVPQSDEEEVKEKEEKAEKAEENEKGEEDPGQQSEEESAQTEKESKPEKSVLISFEDLERRTIALPVPVANYVGTIQGPEGHVFLAESKPGTKGLTLQKFSLKDREAKEFMSGVRNATSTPDGKHLLVNSNGSWQMVGTGGPKGDGKAIKMNLEMKLDRGAEWKQIFEEAWRYERDYFYDPGLHGRDWNEVYERYAPLVPHVRHREDLTYILDQMNGELSVGHSFVFGGDYPETDRDKVGLLGCDLEADQGYWKITRIFTNESWNPELSSPLDRPDVDVKEGYYLVGINGKELTAKENPFWMLDGTRDKQTTIHINSSPSFEGAWEEVVKPVGTEYGLRQRAWVEDNRRMVDELSGGKLAYIWVPNTSGSGFVSFNRYFFAQQDKLGAVIDERFNGGGLLDDYMVDLMTRKLRAAITNEVPGGKALRLPTGILGPKALLINELAGSGGDFFPWVFKQQKAGPLIGQTTWGGLVKSSVHYALIDGGALTAPDNAVFDPYKREWIAENRGVSPDIEVRQDAKSLNEGRDPQLERAIQEVLKMLENYEIIEAVPPAYPRPARGQ